MKRHQSLPRSANRHTKSPSTWKLQGCNIILILLGVVMLTLAGTQFSIPLALPNSQYIDLRPLLSSFPLIAGTFGLWCTGRGSGFVLLKTLYMATMMLAVIGIGFYAFTSYRVATIYNHLTYLEQRGELVDGFIRSPPKLHPNSQQYILKVIISGLSVIIAAFSALTAMVSLFLLEPFVMVERVGWMPALIDDQQRLRSNRTQLAIVSGFKLIASLLALGVAAWNEVLHQQTSFASQLQAIYIRIALDHVAAVFGIASALADLFAIFEPRKSLNLKVSIGMSLVTATWCVKSIDNNLFPLYKSDLVAYRSQFTVGNNRMLFSESNGIYYVILIVHSALVALFSAIYLISVASAIVAVSCLRIGFCSKTERKPKTSSKWHIATFRLLRFTHFLWACSLVALAILGIGDFPWNGDFIGIDLLWLALLSFSASIFYSSNKRTSDVLLFVLNTLIFSVFLEKTIYTINMFYQSVVYEAYNDKNLLERSAYFGQIGLYLSQLVVLIGETLTSLCGMTIHGKGLKRIRWHRIHDSRRGLYCFCALGSLIYGTVLTACYVLFEYGRWNFAEVPVISCFRPEQLLTASLILQTVLTSLAAFVVSPAFSNVYYLHMLWATRSFGGELTEREYTIVVSALIIAAIASLACVLQLFFGCVAILRAFYLLYHQDAEASASLFVDSCNGGSRSSTLQIGIDSSPTYRQHHSLHRGNHTLPIYTDNNRVYINGISHQQQNSRKVVSTQKGPSTSPFVHQIEVRPIEEQSLYWSPDEEPNVYKATRRLYHESRQSHSTLSPRHETFSNASLQ